MDQGAEVVREVKLISIQEKMKSFSNPLMQCGVSELINSTLYSSKRSSLTNKCTFINLKSTLNFT